MESKNNEGESDSETHAENYEPDVHFEPVVTLPLVEHVTLEEDESALLNLRAKLYRYDTEESPAVWKERGTGTVKILHHKSNKTARVVMRRDKTFKICANHFITPELELCKPSSKKKNWWIWTVPADFADEVSKSEIFAINFGNEENAILWEEKFKHAQEIIQVDDGSDKENEHDSNSSDESSGEDCLVNDLSKEPEEISNTLTKLNLSK